jgi:hypothetical protein
MTQVGKSNILFQRPINLKNFMWPFVKMENFSLHLDPKEKRMETSSFRKVIDISALSFDIFTLLVRKYKK